MKYKGKTIKIPNKKNEQVMRDIHALLGVDFDNIDLDQLTDDDHDVLQERVNIVIDRMVTMKILQEIKDDNIDVSKMTGKEATELICRYAKDKYGLEGRNEQEQTQKNEMVH